MLFQGGSSKQEDVRSNVATEAAHIMAYEMLLNTAPEDQKESCKKISAYFTKNLSLTFKDSFHCLSLRFFTFFVHFLIGKIKFKLVFRGYKPWGGLEASSGQRI